MVPCAIGHGGADFKAALDLRLSSSCRHERPYLCAQRVSATDEDRSSSMALAHLPNNKY